MIDFSWNKSYDEIRDMLEAQFRVSHHDIGFYVDKTVDIGVGASDGCSVVIGDYGLKSGDDCFSMIRSVFHEYRHVDQLRSNFVCCGKYASECRLDEIASRGSSLYYGAGARVKSVNGIDSFERFLYTRYFWNIREIDAEYNGVLDAYDFLLAHPSLYNGDMDGAFLEHINNKAHKPGKPQEYFLDFYEPIRSMEELDQKFESQFVDRVRSLRPGYKPVEDDVSFVGILANSDIPDWSGAFSRYQRVKDGFEERRILAGIVRAVHPEYTRNLPYSDRTAISTFRTFHMTRIPEIPESVKKRFNVLPDDERRKYYLESVDRLSQFDVLDGSPGAGLETVPDFSENFP